MLLVSIFIISPAAHSEHQAFQFWLHSAYSDTITINKATPVFNSLGKLLGKKIHYRAASDEKKILQHIDNKAVDLILWGSSPEFGRKLLAENFKVLTYSQLEVGLYIRAGEDQLDYLDDVKIGGLKLSASVEIAKQHFISNGIQIDIREYVNYYQAMLALSNREIDFLVATSVLFRPLGTTIAAKYQKVISFPKPAKIMVYINNNKDVTQQRIIQQYFFDNSSAIDKVFGTGEFIQPQAIPSQPIDNSD